MIWEKQECISDFARICLISTFGFGRTSCHFGVLPNILCYKAEQHISFPTFAALCDKAASVKKNALCAFIDTGP